MADQRKGIFYTILTCGAVAMTLVASAGLVLSSLSSMLSPSDNKYAVVMCMMFPGWLIAAMVMFVVDLIWWKRTSIVAGVAMLVCLPWINDFMPLHLRVFGMSEQEKERSFTLMTYNVMQLRDQTEHIESATNAQLDYILAVDADIVCMQEAEYLQPTIRNNVAQQQIDELRDRYPYVFVSQELALLSKYPAEPLPFKFPVKDYRSGDIAGWRVVIDDRIINIFNVHLRSLAFTKHHRQVFRDIVSDGEVNTEGIKDTRRELMPLLLAASKEREGQVRELQSYLRKFGGENAIVCGDFNDPVGCYGLYLLENESDMRQAYADAGFGPTITYNANHFFFRIDHILYRGAMRPWQVVRGNLKSSDHYPLTATFILDEKQ